MTQWILDNAGKVSTFDLGDGGVNDIVDITHYRCGYDFIEWDGFNDADIIFTGYQEHVKSMYSINQLVDRQFSTTYQEGASNVLHVHGLAFDPQGEGGKSYYYVDSFIRDSRMPTPIGLPTQYNIRIGREEDAGELPFENGYQPRTSRNLNCFLLDGRIGSGQALERGGEYNLFPFLLQFFIRMSFKVGETL